MSHVFMTVGLPASGKGSHVEDLAKTHRVLNRDTAGGNVADLLPAFKAALAAGENVVLDNTFLTVAGRAAALAAAQAAGAPVTCLWMQTSFEDCQVNALNRMWDRYGECFMTADEIKAHALAYKDPNIFPVAALFVARKRLEGVKKKGVWEIPSGKPTMAEGFDRIEKVPFERRPYPGVRRALIFDYDGTLRLSPKKEGTGMFHYPVKPTEVQTIPGVPARIRAYLEDADGLPQRPKYRFDLVLGVTTQSGIGKGVVFREDVEACLRETERQVGLDKLRRVRPIETHLCPHYNFPVSCYCRKPQPGLGVMLIRKHGLEPSHCLYVGDQKTDATFAARCGFQFQHIDEFLSGSKVK